MELKVGNIVLVNSPRNPTNGTHVHPAIVNRVWNNTNPNVVNVTVFPDHSAPYCLGSVPLLETYGEAMEYQGEKGVGTVVAYLP